MADMLETEIPLPGLAESRSQLAVPIVVGGTLLGVLYVESAQDGASATTTRTRWSRVAAQLGMAIRMHAGAAESRDGRRAAPPPARRRAARPVAVRHYAATTACSSATTT